MTVSSTFTNSGVKFSARLMKMTGGGEGFVFLPGFPSGKQSKGSENLMVMVSTSTKG